MRKELIISILAISSFAAHAQNNDPYAVFGHKSDVTYETKKEFFKIFNSDTNSLTKALAFNIEEGMILFLGAKDTILDKVQMNPEQLLRWLSIDPLASKYPSLSPYVYVANNPTNAVDPDGQKIIFVNGYYNSGEGAMPGFIARNLAGTEGGRNYWSNDFVKGAKTFFNDQRTGYVDGTGAWNSTGEERFNAGYEYAKANLKTITAGMVEGETVKIVSHSMGSAYSEGMIKYLQEQNIPIEKVVHLSAADPSGFKTSSAPTLQLNLSNDPVLLYKNAFENNMVEGADRYGTVNTQRLSIFDIFNSHADTKLNASTWSMVSDLQNLQMNSCGESNYATGNNNGTQFNFLNLGGNSYSSNGTTNGYSGPLAQ